MNSENNLNLQEKEQLQLLQLSELHDWASRHPMADSRETANQSASSAETLPKQWSFMAGVNLYDWQQVAVQQWFAGGNRGIIKVVTGAGKTMLALAASERLQRIHPDLRIAIVVPTIESWSRLSEQNLRYDKWSVCRG